MTAPRTKHSAFQETPGYTVDFLKIVRVLGRLRGRASAHRFVETIWVGGRSCSNG